MLLSPTVVRGFVIGFGLFYFEGWVRVLVSFCDGGVFTLLSGRIATI